MTSAEFDLLRTFCERPGRVLSRDSLLDLTQGRIRRKIEPDPQNATMIKTVRSGATCSRRPWMRSRSRPTAGHETARLSQSEGNRRPDRGAGGDLDRGDSPDNRRDLSDPPTGSAIRRSATAIVSSQPSSSFSARRPRPNGRGSSPISRARFRNWKSPNFRRARPLQRTSQRGPTSAICIVALAAVIACFGSGKKTTVRSESRCRTEP